MLNGRAGRTALLLAAALSVAACASRDADPRLLNIRSGTDGPDEFAILPPKPLEPPRDYASLPLPTPGGANRTDPTPQADAVAALGGRPSALSAPGIPAADQAILNHAGRNGVDPGIRGQLAAEDVEFRQGKRPALLERLFKVNTYFRAYRPQELDQYRELERMRQAGIRTPAAPPDPARRAR